MRRRLHLILFALLAVLVTGQVPARAAGSEDPPVCSVHVPAKVVATAPYTAVWPTFTDCDGLDHVYWGLYAAADRPDTGPRGYLGIENGVSQGPWRYRDSYPTGKYYVDLASDAIVPGQPEQNTTQTVVKFGSRITLKSSREGIKVPLTGVVSRYVASVNGFRRWAHRPVAISYRDCTTCAWKFLVMDKTDKYGVYSLGAVSVEARYYRAKVGATATTWDQTSAPVLD